MCNKCKIVKPLDEFYPQVNGKFGRSPYCGICDAARAKERYNNPVHHERRKDQIYNARLRRKLEVMQALAPQYAKGCVDCGVTEFHHLDWDHKDDVLKHLPLSKMWNYSKAKILEEVAKCELRCAHCHRTRTAAQLKWIDWQKIVSSGDSIESILRKVLND